MDTTWLDDFLTLADCLNFSRAAERRGITQPAMTRRIQSLEQWLGAALFSRDTHRLALTDAGEAFRPAAHALRRHLEAAKRDVAEAAARQGSQLRFASTHALSLTFLPDWLRRLERDAQGAFSDAPPDAITSDAPLGASASNAPLGAIRLTVDSMAACERIMLDGRCHFLLTHHHEAAATALGPGAFRSLLLGRDTLLPVSAPREDGTPAHALPGSPDAPVDALHYDGASGLGRILAAVRAASGPPCWLRPVFTTHAAIVLGSMARQGRGLAFAPLSLVAEDLAAGRLVRAGDARWDVPVEIRLVRPAARQSPAAERFWARLSDVG